MTSAAEDDVHAEQQIQASLRRVVADQAAPSLPSETCEEQTPALSNPEHHIECRATHISLPTLPRTTLSPKLSVHCSSEAFKQSTALEHADGFLSATGDQSGIDFGPLQKDDVGDNVRDFCEENIPVSPHHPLTFEQDKHPKALSGVSVMESEARQYSDQDIIMEDVSSSSPNLPWIKAEMAWTSTPALPKPSSTVTNPWSIFASPTNLNAFPLPASSFDFRFGNQSSSTVTSSQAEAEKLNGFPACPSLFNKDVAQCQRTGMLKLPGNGVESLTVHRSAYDTSRYAQQPSTGSSEVADEKISSSEDRDLNAHDDKKNGFVNDIRPDRLAMISGQDKSVQIKMLSESQRECGMKWKPSGTATEAIPPPSPPRERDLIVHSDKQNDFFGGLHPSRMTLISEREPSLPQEMFLHSKWKPTGSNLVQRRPVQDMVKIPKGPRSNPVQWSPVQDIVKIPKGPQYKEHIQKIETSICSSKSLSTKDSLKAETQFAIEAIASLKKRYAPLDQSFPLGKEWFFALQEIAAIFRTTTQYDYTPHIPGQEGYTVQLKTDFKVFRLREHWSKKQGKEMITKKAVLYVIDGPFFFKQATSALNGRRFHRRFLRWPGS